jgi:hypothetical protein
MIAMKNSAMHLSTISESLPKKKWPQAGRAIAERANLDKPLIN